MSEKVTFYYNPMSRGRIVHWMLEEAEADYEIKLLDWEKRDQKSPEYLKINPMGKIPSIVHRGVVVTETAAICAYLADAFPQAKLAPPVDSPERGAYYRWFFFTTNCVEPALLDKKYPRATEAPSGYLGYGTYEDTMKTLDGTISKGFLLGDQFSAADVYLSSVLGYALQMKNIETKPSLENYLKRCIDRQAYQRYMEKAGPLPS